MVYFMKNPIKMDDLGVPLFLETPIYKYIWTPPKKDRCLFFWKAGDKHQESSSTPVTIEMNSEVAQ